MLKHPVSTLAAVLALTLVTACSGTDYQPAVPQSQAVDLTEFAPRVDTFVVLLDTSGSMAHEAGNSIKAQQAQDLVANFNAAVPEAGFNAGLVIFGKGAGPCLGDGVAKKVYGMETYNTQAFQSALEDVGCVRSTTPIVSALDIVATALPEDAGDTAVIIFSDFKWNDPDGVRDMLDAVTANASGTTCVHAVRLGDDAYNADLISEISGVNSCGSSVAANAITDSAAMTAYAADILMSPIAYEKFTLSAMTLFDFDKSVLKAEGKEELQRLSEHIRSKGIKVRDIDVIGHTDSVGTQIYNASLSERRAQAVEAYLVSEGVNPSIIDTSGMGELDPVASNANENGRARNRRVEVLIGAAAPADR